MRSPRAARRPRRPGLTAGLSLALAAAVLVGGCGGSPPAHIASSPYSPYVALGDSYTAAPGVPEPQSGDVCLRSTNNYPSIVASRLHIPAFTDRSCGGAATGDMTHSQFDGVPPQFDALHDSTKLVTVGIGGGDLDISTALLVYCPGLGKTHPHGAPCTDAAERNDKDLIGTVLPKLTQRIEKVLAGIHDRAPNARVLVIGYPQIVPSEGTCKQYPAAAGDYFYLREVNSGLNDAVKKAADKAGDTFVDVWSASEGHDTCAAHPWINGFGKTASPDAGALHPLRVEQEAVARLIESVLTK